MNRTLSYNKWLIIFIIAALFLIGGFVTVYLINGKETILPSPILNCPNQIVWNSIVPGVSTRQDVTEMLGKPDDKGRDRFRDGRSIPYYAYNLEEGEIAKFEQHRIFFRSNGKVDWIEVIVADSDGTFHKLREMVDQLGSTLDTTYLNNNYNPYVDFQYDVVGGPDMVLVWSECGIAVDVLWGGPWGEENYVDPNLDLNIRYPTPQQIDENEVDNLDGVIMMEFLFHPTTFNGFEELYKYRIPYDMWIDYLEKTKQ